MRYANLDDTLARLGACHKAREWCATQLDARTAWQNCTCTEWMVWLAIRVRVTSRLTLLVHGLEGHLRIYRGLEPRMTANHAMRLVQVWLPPSDVRRYVDENELIDALLEHAPRTFAQPDHVTRVRRTTHGLLLRGHHHPDWPEHYL